MTEATADANLNITPAEPNWLDRRIWAVNWEQALYLLFVVLAIASRFVMLGLRVQSHDESLHTRYSWELYNGDGFSHTPLMHGPFLFHVTALSYWLFGDNDFTARVPVAIMGVMLVAFPYLLRRWLGRYGALAASFLFLVSPSVMYYSRYIRMVVPTILFAMVVVWASWEYLRNRSDKYLFWFAAALSLMFATKEVAFMYVAIFGSFLVLRLAVGLLEANWEVPSWRTYYTVGLLGVLLGVAIFGVGMAGAGAAKKAAAAAALDPAAQGVEATQATQPGQEWMVVESVGGAVIALSVAVTVLAALLGMKRRLRDYPEFDLIILYSTLLLPYLAAVPITWLGWDPLDYSNPGIVRSAAVLVPMLIATVAVGLWWNWRRWLAAAGIFYAIFVVLFTTVFTNGQGFATGWIGSLGYWIVQQEVQRGGQPWYFYLFVAPIYEFLPILASAGALLLCGVKGLKLVGRALRRGGRLDQPDREKMFGFVSFLVWWTALTWVLYSYAGEKMGWLTTDIIAPMIVLAGWFLGRLLGSLSGEQWKSGWKSGGWALVVLLPVVYAALMLGIRPALFGQLKLGSQDLESLKAVGRVVAGVAVAVGGGFVIYHNARKLPWATAWRIVMAAGFALLAIATVRVAWMASFINFDNAKEYLVYAHGGSGTKEVMRQIEDLSLRLYGDLSIRVAFDDDTSWPYWWYLRDYPNKVFYGSSPSRDALDAPIVLAGDKTWNKADPYLGSRYYSFEYNFVQWPMEDYKGMTWDRIRGALVNPEMRAALWDILVNREYEKYAAVVNRDFSLAKWPLRHPMRMYIRKDVVSQLWDYGVGPSVTQAPAEVDPYETKFQPDLLPARLIGGAGGGPGQLQTPRGIAVGPDDLLYVADAGNNRIQVFQPDGQFVRGWGSLCDLGAGAAGCVDPDGSGPQPLGAGQFKEPWGVAVAADGSVYVADTWNHRIQQFTAAGEFVRAWGGLGQAGAGQQAGEMGIFYGPRDIAVGPAGLLYITDTGNKRIQVYQADGRFVGEFGEGGPLDGQLDEPVGLEFGSDGLLYVADTWNGRVDVFDQNHTFVRSWNVKGWFGQSVNNKPYLATDANGRVYITDPELYRVLVFDVSGAFLYGFGRYSNSADGMALPTGIAVGADGTIYVSDAENNRILGYLVQQ